MPASPEFLKRQLERQRRRQAQAKASGKRAWTSDESDRQYADALHDAAYAITAEEREAARQRLAQIEQLLPGRHTLTPEDLVGAALLLEQAGHGVEYDSPLSLPEDADR